FNFRAINPSARSESNEQAKRIKNRVCSPTQAKYRSAGTSNSRKPLIRLGTLSIPESTPVRQSFSNPKPHKSRKRARMLASFVALVIKRIPDRADLPQYQGLVRNRIIYLSFGFGRGSQSLLNRCDFTFHCDLFISAVVNYHCRNYTLDSLFECCLVHLSYKGENI